MGVERVGTLRKVFEQRTLGGIAFAGLLVVLELVADERVLVLLVDVDHASVAIAVAILGVEEAVALEHLLTVLES